MVRITFELLKKKSEHNEDRSLSELEEIALHQLEIEKIEVIGKTCRKLKILLLQDNIISKIENINLLKNLQILNLALNNIEVIEGLDNCEFLKKLDLTLNFVGLSNFEESMRNLKKNRFLEDLQLMGNPCLDWPNGESYVISKLDQLKKLNGRDIKKSIRIIANQKMNDLDTELASFVRTGYVFAIKGKKTEEEEDVEEDEERYPHTPEVRTKLYREVGAENAAKEKQNSERFPKERDFKKEHEDRLKKSREENYFKNGRVKQCNEGEYTYKFEEDEEKVYMTVFLPVFLDTSLIHCDIHPHFICVVIKNKILRLSLPHEIQSDTSKCQRSTSTGELKLTMPKLNINSHLVFENPCKNRPRNVKKQENQQARTKAYKILKEKKMSSLLNTVKSCEISSILKKETDRTKAISVISSIEDTRVREVALNVPPV